MHLCCFVSVRIVLPARSSSEILGTYLLSLRFGGPLGIVRTLPDLPALQAAFGGDVMERQVRSPQGPAVLDKGEVPWTLPSPSHFHTQVSAPPSAGSGSADLTFNASEAGLREPLGGSLQACPPTVSLVPRALGWGVRCGHPRWHRGSTLPVSCLVRREASVVCTVGAHADGSEAGPPCDTQRRLKRSHHEQMRGGFSVRTNRARL